MSEPRTTWEYARLSVATRLELSLKKWDELDDPAEARRVDYVYRWETQREHAQADTALELLDKLALDVEEHSPADLTAHTPLSVLNALGAEGWELVHIQRFEEPELDVPGRFAGRDGWYYLFRRAAQRAPGLAGTQR